MDMEEAWNLTREVTRVVRRRKHLLYTFGATKLPYLCLVPVAGDGASVRVHSGTVAAERPQIAIPGAGDHDFEGFDPEAAEGAEGPDESGMIPIWLARRIAMPSGKYINRPEESRTEPGPLPEVVERLERRLDGENDIRTALMTSDDRVWRLSVLMYIAEQVARSAPSNVIEHLDHRHPGWNRH